MLHSALSVLVSIVKNLIEITDYELGHRVFQTTSIRLHKPLTQRKPINLINDRIYRSDTAMNKTQGELTHKRCRSLFYCRDTLHALICDNENERCRYFINQSI